MRPWILTLTRAGRDCRGRPTLAFSPRRWCRAAIANCPPSWRAGHGCAASLIMVGSAQTRGRPALARPRPLLAAGRRIRSTSTAYLGAAGVQLPPCGGHYNLLARSRTHPAQPRLAYASPGPPRGKGCCISYTTCATRHARLPKYERAGHSSPARTDHRKAGSQWLAANRVDCGRRFPQARVSERPRSPETRRGEFGAPSVTWNARSARR